MANLLKIVPIIKYENGKLEKHGVGRVFRKSVINSGLEVLEANEETHLLHGGQKEITDIKSTFEKEINGKIDIAYFPPVVTLHTGPGVVAFLGRKR